MHGISGTYAYLGVSPAVAVGDGWRSPDGRVGLGSAAHSADGVLAVSFDGEGTNAAELLELYVLQGPAMIARVSGAFSLALWDGRQRRLLLARDAGGSRPLHYADDGWTLRFSSQSMAAGASREVPAGTVIVTDATGPGAPVPSRSVQESATMAAATVTAGARILALVGDCYAGKGGIARYNQDLFEALAAGGARIVILPRLDDASGLALPAGIRQLPPVYGRLAYAVAALRTALTEGPFDLLFCGHAFMSPLAWAIARLLRVRWWMQVHGTDIWEDRRAIVRRAIEASDMVTAVSRGTRQILMSWARLAPDQVRVLPNTIRDMFGPGKPSPELAARLQLGPGPVLLTVGRLSSTERYKGHEQIFAVLPALRACFPTLLYLVAGDGDDRAFLERRAAELARDPGAVRFLGFVPDKDLPDLYRLCDLYVMPSTQEGFGIVYLEAAACGLKSVGGMGGGSADAIPDERIGVIVDPADNAALVEAIARLLGQGKADPAAVEPYRRPHFAAGARLLLARLLAQPRRMRGAS